MGKKTFRIALLTGALLVMGLCVTVLPAGAEKRRFTITLVGGKTVTVVVDVPSGAPASQVDVAKLAGGLPVVGVTEDTPPAPAPTTPGPNQPPPPGGQNGNPGTAPGTAPGTGTPGSGPDRTPSGKDDAQKRTKPGKARSRAKGKDKGSSGTSTLGGVNDLTGQEVGKAKRKRKAAAEKGAPTAADPTFRFAEPGPIPLGVPNFFIDQFRIPPFLLAIYQAAGTQYGIPWQVLASINEIETDYGRNLSVSTAGAVGWMQFLPSTFRRYGVDANDDGRKDPYNPVDAIFSSARYLRAAGGEKNLRKAIFAYNHADWYVKSVLLRAKLIGGLPSDLVGSLTGLTQGHFPVAARARYADNLDQKKATARVKRGSNAAVLDEGSAQRKSIEIFAKTGAPVIAVNDGRIVKIGRNARLGRFVSLQDVYGNTYTYANLGSVAQHYPVPKPRKVSAKEIAKQLRLPARDAAPQAPASAGRQPAAKVRVPRQARKHAVRARGRRRPTAPAAPPPAKERLFAAPQRPAAKRSGGARQLAATRERAGGVSTFRNYFTRAIGLSRKDVVLKPLKRGASVIGGTILGRVAKPTEKMGSHLSFSLRPAGKGAPLIDPKPVLDGWKLLESTAVYRAAGKNPFFGPDARNPSIGQLLLMSKESLERRVLADPRAKIYDCGRRDIQAGTVDRRVLASIEFLVASGMNPTVTSLECGHGFMTRSGNVSEHSSGNAVDIAAVNGISILGHQGRGSITELTIRRLLTLQGTMKPHQIISLMTFAGADNTMSLPDHANHIHVGFRPLFGSNTKLARQVRAVLKPKQWIKLIDRIGNIPNPTVPIKPSRYAIRDNGHPGTGGD